MEGSSYSRQGRTVTAEEATSEVRLPGGFNVFNSIATGGALLFCLLIAAIAVGIALQSEQSNAWLLIALVAVPSLAALAFYAPQAYRRARGGALRVTPGSLFFDQPAIFRSPLEVPVSTVRKAVIDDGHRWGHVEDRFRFPVYDIRADGTGSRELLGALWAPRSRRRTATSMLPSLDPTDGQPPNVALLFEPRVRVPKLRYSPLSGPQKGEAMVGVLLRTADPSAARATLSAITEVSDLDWDDGKYLGQGLLTSTGAENGSLAVDSDEPPVDGRLPLLRRRVIRNAWLGLLVGLAVPVIALYPAWIGYVMLTKGGDRKRGAFLAAAGSIIFAGRLYLWLAT